MWYIPLGLLVIAAGFLTTGVLLMPLALVRARIYRKPTLLRRTLKIVGFVLGFIMVLYILDGGAIFVTSLTSGS